MQSEVGHRRPRRIGVASWGVGQLVSKEALPGKVRERASYFGKYLANPFSHDVLKGYLGLQKRGKDKMLAASVVVIN